MVMRLTNDDLLIDGEMLPYQRDEMRMVNDNPIEWEYVRTPEDNRVCALFWRCYLGAVAVVMIGCGLWAYYG